MIHHFPAISSWGDADGGGDISKVGDWMTAGWLGQMVMISWHKNMWSVPHRTELMMFIIIWKIWMCIYIYNFQDLQEHICTDNSQRFQVKDQLVNVQEISASERAFTAILATGRVVSWGHLEYGACSLRECLSIDTWLRRGGATFTYICSVPKSEESRSTLLQGADLWVSE